MKTIVIIPALNEEKTIATVIGDFHREVPDAEIRVINNNSSDDTGRIAREAIVSTGCAGAVHSVARRGKSNAVRWAFRNLDADIYVMVDADGTYPARHLPDLIKPVALGDADMVIGDRLSGEGFKENNPRPLHHCGNRLVQGLINFLFSSDLSDIMSGYRVFSRAFVKNCPITCEGFELETQMTLHALDKKFHIVEVPVALETRPEGSTSKLRTFSDGSKVISTVFRIFRYYRPLGFFGCLAFIFYLGGLAFGAMPIYDYIMYKYVYHVPSAILAAGLMVFSVTFFAIGVILDTIAIHDRMRFEQKMLDYHDRGRSAN